MSPYILIIFKSSPFTKVHSLYSIIIDVKNVEILSIVFLLISILFFSLFQEKCPKEEK